MNKTQIAQKILEAINYDINNINENYISVEHKIAPKEFINKIYGSFEALRRFVDEGVGNGSLRLEDNGDNSSNNVSSIHASDNDSGSSDSNDGSSGSGNKKVVKIMKHDGTVLKATVPSGMNLKEILKSANIDTEEGFEIRVNNSKEEDPFSVPDDGSLISATRQIKGN